jgi:UDP-N-acetylmuramate--alanine ligase
MARQVLKFEGSSGTRLKPMYESGSDTCDNADLAGKRFHFIGAGGVGMSGLAQLLIKNKAIVTGSDQMATAVVDKLNGLGARISIGHNACNLDTNADAVVISAAVRDDNPEFMAARANGVKIYKYAEMLGVMMDYYEGIAVAGTHGKSTTSGWLVYTMREAGRNPNFIVGADLLQLHGSSGAADSEWFVAEACEYDRSFLNYRPKIGCVLNIEQDHLDYYKDENEIVEAFCDFAGGIKRGGVLVGNGQNANVREVFGSVESGLTCQTFGIDGEFSFSARNLEQLDGGYKFDVYRDGVFLGRTKISLAGKHNVSNALAVIALAVNAGLQPEVVLEKLDRFTGMDRRVMLKDTVGGVTVLDDYAHHPTEIRASLEAIRQRYRPNRLWCVFQPHQYSRTRFLLNDFAESFKLADITIVPAIYFVRDTEENKKEVNAQVLVERIRKHGEQALHIDGFEPIVEHLAENVRPGDAVVTMGAGNIWKVADDFIRRLGEHS